MKSAIFVRVSTARQDYQRQISDLEKEAERQNLQVVEIIKEKISGASRRQDREGIQRLLQLSSTRQIDKVLVSEVSRLGRSTGDNLQLLDELTSYGVSVYSLDMGIDTLQDGKRTMVAELLFTVFSSLACQERERLSAKPSRMTSILSL
ncbi:MAG: recombinase family protein [Cyclobacteriaceae bacterium]